VARDFVAPRDIGFAHVGLLGSFREPHATSRTACLFSQAVPATVGQSDPRLELSPAAARGVPAPESRAQRIMHPPHRPMHLKTDRTWLEQWAADSAAPHDGRFARVKQREARRKTRATSVQAFLFRLVARRLSCSTHRHSLISHQRSAQTRGLHGTRRLEQTLPLRARYPTSRVRLRCVYFRSTDRTSSGRFGCAVVETECWLDD
jgi:hypothetical protein